MRKTYIIHGVSVGGCTRLSTRRDKGAIRGEARLEPRVARAEGRLDLRIKTGETAMRQSSSRQEQRLLVGLLQHGLLHVRVTLLHRLAVVLYVLPGMAVVHGQLRLR